MTEDAFLRPPARALPILGSVAVAVAAIAVGCRLPVALPFAPRPDRCELVGDPRGTDEHGADWSPDGSHIVCMVAYNPDGRFEPGVHLIEVHTGRWKRVLATVGLLYPPLSYFHPRYPQDRRLLLDYDPGAAILDPDTGALTYITDPLGWGPIRCRWSPEGDSLWFGSYGGMFVQAASGGSLRPFMLESGRQLEFTGFDRWSFSPDGRAIAYSRRVPEESSQYGSIEEIFVVGRDGRHARRLTYLRGVAHNPTWIHGGREILIDYVPPDCFVVAGEHEHQWIAINVHSGVMRWLGQHLGSAKFRDSFPIGVDRTGTVAAVVAADRTRLHGGLAGTLHLTPIEKDLRRELTRPSDAPIHGLP